MAKTPSILDESLNRAQASVAKAVLMRAISSLPGSMTMGQLIDDFAGSEHNEFFRDMSLNSFIQAVEGRSDGRSRGGADAGSEFNTRTQEGRDEIDAAVARFLESGEDRSSEEIRAAIGGTPPQLRESMARLAQAGMVVITGQKRGTRYAWKSGKGKKSK
jgi:hypothetical protein